MRNFNLKSVVAVLVAALVMPVFAAAQSGAVKGSVTDENGLPVFGATVMVKGTSSWTTTDADGKFTVYSSADQCVVEVSYLGYETLQVVAKKGANLSLQLKPDASSSLNEVVVIGYGQTKKSDLTGSVTSVKMEELQVAPVMSVDEALQGRAAGVDVMSTSGDPSAGTSIRVRGSRSITASNEPLIVLDGVIDAVQSMSDINPADIASVSILKDASSTAIYGSRGSNGVIMITTKAGTSSKPSVTFKAEAGFSQIAKYMDTMNATEFAQYYNDYRYFLSWRNTEDSAHAPIESYARYPDPISLGEGTNWLKQITRIAPYQNYNISLNGKSGGFKYFASIGYSDREGIVKASGSKRVTGRLNVDYDIAKWLTLGYKGSYTYVDNDQNRVNIGGTYFWNGAIYLSPILKPADVRNETYNNSPLINNPQFCLDLTEKNQKRHTQNHAAVITIKPVKGLVIKSQNTYMLYQRHDYQWWSANLPATVDGTGSTAYRYEGDATKLSTENTINYKYTSRTRHSIDVMGGYTASVTSTNNMSVKCVGLLADELKWGSLASIQDKKNITLNSGADKITRMSALVRMNYDYNKLYYLTFTGRADGSSNFAANNKWGFFPSGAFKWMISNEKFMRGARKVDELALRLSAGRTGNDAISAYRSLEGIYPTTGGYLFGGDQPVAMYPNRFANPDLRWEKTDTYNIGIDASFFKERLSLTFEAYYARTSDLLLTVQTGHVTGYATRYENIGNTTNKGIEATITGRIIDKRNFGWTSTLTLSHNTQMVNSIGEEARVVALSGPGSNAYMMYGYKKGYPLNALWGFQYGGVWHNQAEIDRNNATHTYVSTTTDLGMPRYVDINKDGTLSEDDLVYMGSADPIIYGGWQNTFHIGKHLRLGMFFSYSLGGKIYNYSETEMCGSAWTNQYRKMLNSWHPVRNPQSDIPRAGASNPMLPSDFMIYDASYLRLKSLNISYTFDVSKKTKAFRDITIGASGENLFLLSKYPGFDPDVSTESDSSTLRRVDLGAYPKARTIVFSVQIRY